MENILKWAWVFFCAQLNAFKYLLSQFKIRDLFAHIVCSIWSIDRTLSGTTSLGQSGPGSNGNEGILRVHQISILPSDYLVSSPGIQDTCWGMSYLTAETQSVYSTAPADWAVDQGVMATKNIQSSVQKKWLLLWSKNFPFWHRIFYFSAVLLWIYFDCIDY